MFDANPSAATRRTALGLGALSLTGALAGVPGVCPRPIARASRRIAPRRRRR